MNGVFNFLKQFQINVVCVQDPFVLEHNTTANVNEKVKLKIIWEFTQAMHKANDQRFCTVSPHNNWGLTLLYSDDPVSVGPTELALITGNNSAEMSTATATTPYSIFVEMQSSKLPKAFIESCDNLSEMKETWCHKMYLFTCKVLEELLNFEVSLKTFHNHDAKSDVLEEASSAVEGTESQTSDSCSNVPEDMTLPRSVVEEPLSEMSIETTSSVNNGCPKRHPSGSSDNDEEARKRHKWDTDIEQSSETHPELLLETKNCASSEPSVSADVGHLRSSVNSQTYFKQKCTNTRSASDLNQEIESVHLSTKHRLWMNRKRVQRRVRQTEDHGYEMEAQVSRLMLQNQLSVENNATIEFDIAFFRRISSANTCLVANFYPLTNQKEFSCFYIFFKSFLLKLIDRSTYTSETLV